MSDLVRASLEASRQVRLGSIAGARKCLEANEKMNAAELKKIELAEKELKDIDAAIERLG